MLAVDLPEEPEDRSVVLDRERFAWQRRDELAPSEWPERRWLRVGTAPSFFGDVPSHAVAWPHLLVDVAPLELLAPTTGGGWERAGYATPDCERFVQPERLQCGCVGTCYQDEPMAAPAPAACATERAMTVDQRDDELAGRGQAVDLREEPTRAFDVHPPAEPGAPSVVTRRDDARRDWRR